LYKEYEEYTKLKNEYPNAYKTGASIRSIAVKLRMAKSTVYFYFNKFRTNPYYISTKFLSYKTMLCKMLEKENPNIMRKSLSIGCAGIDKKASQ